MITAPGPLTAATVHDRPGARPRPTGITREEHTMTTITITEELRELARAVRLAEDRADELTYAASLAWSAGRWSDAADLISEAAELDRSASAMRAEVAA